jgi:hypothetical protein
VRDQRREFFDSEKIRRVEAQVPLTRKREVDSEQEFGALAGSTAQAKQAVACDQVEDPGCDRNEVCALLHSAVARILHLGLITADLASCQSEFTPEALSNFASIGVCFNPSNGDRASVQSVGG